MTHIQVIVVLYRAFTVLSVSESAFKKFQWSFIGYFRIKTMFGSSLPPVVCRRDRVLFKLFLFVCVLWCPTHILLCFCFVYLRLRCQFRWIIHFWLPLRYSLTFIYLAYNFSQIANFLFSELFYCFYSHVWTGKSKMSFRNYKWVG
jgi:hypothetical protein